MKNLIDLAKKTTKTTSNLAFSVYSSISEQHINNVPVINPLLIFILSGYKQLGKDKVVCPTGSFVFLSNCPNIDMRNIPSNEEYLAILIDFDYSDFNQFNDIPNNREPNDKRNNNKKYFQGEINELLSTALTQFIEFSAVAPTAAFQFRKQELLQLIYLSGYEQVATIARAPGLSHQVSELVLQHIEEDWSGELLAEQLCMSESTLRRKLKAENTSIQAIKNSTKLSLGLHLLQTTQTSIGQVAQSCGYKSQSRFTDQFKQLFSMTPRELRKTRRLE